MKKRGIRAIDGFRKKLMIPDFENSKYPQNEVKSNIGSIFVNKKIFQENISKKIYDPYFYEHYKETYNLTTMIRNSCYLELMFILLNIF